MDKAVRALFKQLRAQRELTQPDVAKAGDVAQGLISRIENDPSYEPSASVFMRAVQGLGVTLSEFFLQIERSQNPVLNKRSESANNPPTPISARESADDRALSETAVGVEILLAGFSDAIIKAAERVADRLEQIAGPRRTKAHRGAAVRARRKKAS